MKMAKKLLAVLLSIAMISSITACSSNNSSSSGEESSGGESVAESSKPEDSEKTKLVLFGLNDFDIPDFLAAYEEENNVEVQQILQPSDKFKEAFMLSNRKCFKQRRA